MSLDGDKPTILEGLGQMLEDIDIIEVIDTYTDPSEFLENIAITNPHCVFLDIDMTGFSGIELAEKLSEINPEIQVIFITEYNNYAAQAFEVNAADYILKPVRPERLLKSVEKVREKCGSEKTLPYISLNIQSFGIFEVSIGGTPIKWTRSKPRELFAYLLQNAGEWVDKYKICDDLWPWNKPKQVLANLQTAVWALKKTLKEAGCTQVKINYSLDRYMLQISDFRWDLEQFDTEYKAFVDMGIYKNGKAAERLYKGEYLKDEDWLWADIAREDYSRKYKGLKQKLIKYG